MNTSLGVQALTLLLPAAILALYVYIKDRVEKEPFTLLLLLFAGGAVAALISGVAERGTDTLINLLFAGRFETFIDGEKLFDDSGSMLLFELVRAFVGVAVIEELLRFAATFLLTFKSRHFNSLFDGVVYGTFVSLGFALFDGVRYAFINGWELFAYRAYSVIPCQIFYGVYMGLLYTVWHRYSLAAKEEKRLAKLGKITVTKPFASSSLLILCIVVSVFLHGTLEFVDSVPILNFRIIHYILAALLFVISMITVNRLSRVDELDLTATQKLINKKYPGVYKNDESEAVANE